jgi:hypothetical protein
VADGTARQETVGRACVPRDVRASVRHPENARGRNTLSDEAAEEERGCRNGAERARLQSQARDDYRWHQATTGSDAGMNVGSGANGDRDGGPTL